MEVHVKEICLYSLSSVAVLSFRSISSFRYRVGFLDSSDVLVDWILMQIVQSKRTQTLDFTLHRHVGLLSLASLSLT